MKISGKITTTIAAVTLAISLMQPAPVVAQSFTKETRGIIDHFVEGFLDGIHKFIEAVKEFLPDPNKPVPMPIPPQDPHRQPVPMPEPDVNEDTDPLFIQ